MDPMETHIRGFVQFLLNATVGDSNGYGIVDLNGGGGLGMVHFNECCSGGKGFLPVEKQGSIFGFGGVGHDIAQ